jgi:hypothetical protein
LISKYKKLINCSRARNVVFDAKGLWGYDAQRDQDDGRQYILFAQCPFN